MAKIAFSKLNAKINEKVDELKFNDQVIEIKQYLPFSKKIEIVEELVGRAITNNNAYWNNCLIEVFELILIIENYSNITFSKGQKDDIIKLYDCIVSSGLAKAIINIISDEEINAINELLQTTLTNIYGYTNSIRGILEVIDRDYDNLNLDANAIKEKLSEKSDEILALQNLLTNK